MIHRNEAIIHYQLVEGSSGHGAGVCSQTIFIASRMPALYTVSLHAKRIAGLSLCVRNVLLAPGEVSSVLLPLSQAIKRCFPDSSILCTAALTVLGLYF